jgi:putative cardiolipin synthase
MSLELPNGARSPLALPSSSGRSSRKRTQVMKSRVASLVLIATLLGGCATVTPGSDYPKTRSSAFSQHESTQLGQRVDKAAREHSGYSGFRMLSVGVDGFLTRLQMANSAERSLDLQYYILRGDDTGRLLADAVLRAADRGVRVRLLIDDGERIDGDERIAVLDAHPQIEIRIFNPFEYRGHDKLLRALEFTVSSARLDYRMHNKLFVTDNAVALVGGRNIGDQYFQVDPESQFADDDVFAEGPIVQELSGTFDEYWNSASAIPVAALVDANPADSSLDDYRKSLATHRQQATDETDYASRAASGEPLNGMLSGKLPLVWAHAQLICDSPDKKSVEKGWAVGRLMRRPVVRAVTAAQSELLMITPYLIPGSEGMQLLHELRQRDVRVRVLTNSLESSEVPIAQAGYMHYRVPLLEEGVELHEVRSLLGNSSGSGQSANMSQYGNYSLHAKLFIFDRQRLFIGSMNFDQRSMHLNTEIGLIIDSPELAQQAAARFDAMVQSANAYRLTYGPNAAGELPSLRWHTREGSEVVVYDQEPARSDWQRTKFHLLTLLPLDHEL